MKNDKNNNKQKIDSIGSISEKVNSKNNINEINNSYIIDKINIGNNNKKDIVQEKEANNKNINKYKESNNYPKGLENFGYDSYMNSLLQCFYYIKELRDYFINEKDNFEKENQPVCLALSEVMYGLKYEKKDYFEPINFKKIMGNKNQLFYGKKKGDVKDLYFNLIDCLLTELNSDDKTIEEESSEEKEIDLCNKLEALAECEKELGKNIINELFIGFYETSYFCPNNREKITYSFQGEALLLFDLEKIKKYFGTKDLSIISCFNYYCRTKNNSYFFCYNCNKLEEGICKEEIYRPPKILVLILNRGHGITFDGNVKINEYLDLQNFISEENYEYSSFYQLICVSTYSLKSSSSSFYTARCLTDNNTHYYFHDKNVLKIDKEELFEDLPYILFYKRVEDLNVIKNIKEKCQNKNIEIKKEQKNQNINKNREINIKERKKKENIEKGKTLNMDKNKAKISNNMVNNDSNKNIYKTTKFKNNNNNYDDNNDFNYKNYYYHINSYYKNNDYNIDHSKNPNNNNNK